MNLSLQLILGLILLTISLFLSIFWINFEGFQEFVFRILLSSTVAFLVSGLVGSIELTIINNKNAISATGGIALFLVTWFFNPRKFIEKTTQRSLYQTNHDSPISLENLKFHNSLLISISLLFLITNIFQIIILKNLLPQPFELAEIDYNPTEEVVVGKITSNWTSFIGEQRLFMGVAERKKDINLGSKTTNFSHLSKIKIFHKNFDQITVPFPKQKMYKIYNTKSRYGVCLFIAPKGYTLEENSEFSIENNNQVIKLKGCLHNKIYKENLEDV